MAVVWFEKILDMKRKIDWDIVRFLLLLFFLQEVLPVAILLSVAFGIATYFEA